MSREVDERVSNDQRVTSKSMSARGSKGAALIWALKVPRLPVKRTVLVSPQSKSSPCVNTAVLIAFGGTDNCCSEAPAGGMALLIGPPVLFPGTIDVGLSANPTSGPPGSLFEADVFADAFVDFRGYEIVLQATGGTTGSLVLEDILIDEERPDFVFNGLGPMSGADLPNARGMSVLMSGGVDSQTPVYLATFVFGASSDANGTFTVSAVPGDGATGTLAADSNADDMIVNITSAAQITVP